jgi:hypothetical protein
MKPAGENTMNLEELKNDFIAAMHAAGYPHALDVAALLSAWPMQDYTMPTEPTE